MTINKNQLIQLYSITLGELQNQGQLFTRTWIPAILLVSVLGTLGFFGLTNFIIPAVTSGISVSVLFNFRAIMIFLGAIFGYIFIWSLARRSVEADKCRETANALENILKENTPDENIEISSDLLVARISKEVRESFRAQMCYPFTKQRLLLIPYFIFLGVWIFLWIWAVRISVPVMTY